MTTPEVAEEVVEEPVDPLGDRYDRRSDWVGGLYSPRNAGWYGAEMTPTQRYTGIVSAYLMSAAAVAKGQESELSDEVIMILAWAPHDKDAIAAGLALADTEQPELKELNDSLFGEGYFDFPGYEHLDLPKIGHEGNQRNWYEQGWQQALMGLNGSEEYYMGDTMRDPQYRPVGITGGMLRRMENFAFGKPENTAKQLFDEASVQGDSEDSWMAMADNLMVRGAGTGIDVVAGGIALKGAFLAFEAGASALKTGVGTGFTQRIANTLDWLSKGKEHTGKIRAGLFAGNAAVGAGLTGMDYLTAFMGDPTEEWQDYMDDYSDRKAAALAQGDKTWTDNPTMELLVPLYAEAQAPENIALRNQNLEEDAQERPQIGGIPMDLFGLNPGAGQKPPQQVASPPSAAPPPATVDKEQEILASGRRVY